MIRSRNMAAKMKTKENAASCSTESCEQIVIKIKEKSFFFNVDPNDSIRNFMEKLQKEFNIPIQCQRLVGWYTSPTPRDYETPIKYYIRPTSKNCYYLELYDARLSSSLSSTQVASNDPQKPESLKETETKFLSEKLVRQQLQEIPKSHKIGSEEYQQIMFQKLGNRSYDNFESDQLEHLKEKIGYAFFGPPSEESGYNQKQKNKINEIFEVILNESNLYSEHRNRVIVAFVYVCVEPLQSEKLKKYNNDNTYDQKTDFYHCPVFALLKCRNSPNPCRVFVDHIGRVYFSWTDYIKNNKLPKCCMIVPKDGRYCGNKDGSVYLDSFLSPACSAAQSVLHAADVSTAVVGIGSSAVLISSTISAVVLGPITLIAAGVCTAGVGIYSAARSIGTLVDRGSHKESLSFADSSARGAYLNIVAGALGLVGAGATITVSALATNGVNIATGVTMSVDALALANISAGGLGIANAGYDIIDQWVREDRPPSMLTVVQLSSSVLFFSHAIYNFKSASLIVQEAEHQNLLTTRLRNIFTDLVNEITGNQNTVTISNGYAEAISMMRTMKSYEQLSAILTQSNNRMRQMGVTFSIEGNVLRLNGIAIDLAQVNSIINSGSTNSFSPDFAFRPTMFTQMSTVLKDMYGVVEKLNITEGDVITAFNFVTQLAGSSESVADIMKFVKNVVIELLDYFGLYRFFVNQTVQVDRIMSAVQMVCSFLQTEASKMKTEYDKWYDTQENPESVSQIRKMVQDGVVGLMDIMVYICKTYFLIRNTDWIEKLKSFCHNWISAKCLTSTEEENINAHRVTNPASKVTCSECQGYYYCKK